MKWIVSVLLAAVVLIGVVFGVSWAIDNFVVVLGAIVWLAICAFFAAALGLLTVFFHAVIFGGKKYLKKGIDNQDCLR